MINLDNLEYDKAIEDLVKFRTIPNFKNDLKSLQILADCYWKIRKYQESKFCYDTLVKSNINFSSVERLHLAELSAMNGNYTLASKFLLGVTGFEKKRNGYDNIARLNKEDTSITILEAKKSAIYTLYPALVKDSLIWVNKEQIFSAPKGSDLSKYFSSSNKLRLNSFIESSNQQNSNETIFSNPSSYTYSIETGKIYFTIFQQFFSKKVNTSIPNYLRIAESKLDGSKISEIISFTLGEGYYSMLQPVISPNGKVLIFISNYINNQFDFYFSEKSNSSNSWTKPMPLNILNTNGDEVFPSFGIDDYLYFSTNGREGLGGLDVYKVKLKILGGNDLVIHLPSPINSRHDDYGFDLTEDSTKGSIISKRNGTDISYNIKFNKKLDTLNNTIIFGKYKADLLIRDKNLKNKFILGNVLLNKPLKPLGLSKELLVNKNQPRDSSQIFVSKNDKLLGKINNKVPNIDSSNTDSIKNKVKLIKTQKSNSLDSLINKRNTISTTSNRKNINSKKIIIDSSLLSVDTSYLKKYEKDKNIKSESIAIIPPKNVSSVKNAQSNNSIAKQNILFNKNDTSITKSISREDLIPKEFITNSTLAPQNISISSTLSVDSLKNRISLNPIVLYTAADSVTIDIFDNGKFDHDTISIIYNNNMVVFRNEISTDEKKPVRFSFKMNAYSLKNEIIIVADNLGLEPPNSAIIVITDSLKKQYIKYVSTDLSHNAILHFVKSENKYP